MTKRYLTCLALAVAAGFALAVAMPARACDQHKRTTTTEKKSTKAIKGDKQAPAQEKKAEAASPAGAVLAAACNCQGGEKCTCPKGECKCAKEKTDKPKAAAGSTGSTLLAAGCNCEKGGKNCTCPKGECKCKNCEEHKPKGRSA